MATLSGLRQAYAVSFHVGFSIQSRSSNATGQLYHCLAAPTSWTLALTSETVVFGLPNT